MSSLNVIALISGGKDSFYSILHCTQNGHKVVALGNLYPAITELHKDESGSAPAGRETSENPNDETDLNSFMYQTVGHTIIPLYAEALGLPIYRQQILGGAVNNALTYHPPTSGDPDETESLLPLLKTIIAAHPTANAVSTGAILSTYQRTRVESIALRLGLVPLSYLWQYPNLPPHVPSSLLADMQAAGMDARIIKVASAGLDEGFLWENVASVRGLSRVGRAVARFGIDGDGAVLGEGGEFETLVIDGPQRLFKGRIIVEESARRVVKEGGGSAWLAFEDAKVEMKDDAMEVPQTEVRIPDLLDANFVEALKLVHTLRDDYFEDPQEDAPFGVTTASGSTELQQSKTLSNGHHWTVFAKQLHRSIEQEAQELMTQITERLIAQNLSSSNIISTTIILRSMADFATINKTYSTLFLHPNPPSRVTISSGSAMPQPLNILIHLKLSPSSEPRTALHVQSRSYWAPANIGPYSQAQTVPISPASDISEVHIAGQIPLVPCSMDLPTREVAAKHSPPSRKPLAAAFHHTMEFEFSTILALQHLHRVAVETKVSNFLGGVAYLPRSSKVPTVKRARKTSKAWDAVYGRRAEEASEASDEEDAAVSGRDLWEERYHGSLATRSGVSSGAHQLPDWSFVSCGEEAFTSLMFTAVVEELPRGSEVEWQGLVGLTSGNIALRSLKLAGPGTGFLFDIGAGVGKVSYAVVLVPAESDVADGLADITLDGKDDEVLGSMQPILKWIDVGVKGAWDAATDLAGVVPCWSLWNSSACRLSRVMLYKA